MKKRIVLSEPVIVAQGPTWEEVKWGPYQFPGLEKTDDGTIVCTFNSCADSTKRKKHPLRCFFLLTVTIRIEAGDTQCHTGKREKTVNNCFFEVCHRSKEKRSEAAPSARFDYASGRKEGTPQSNACLQGGGKAFRPEGLRHRSRTPAVRRICAATGSFSKSSGDLSMRVPRSRTRRV